jgi:hypothetical protein
MNIRLSNRIKARRCERERDTQFALCVDSTDPFAICQFLVSVLAPPGLILDMRFQYASNGLPLREWLLHGTKE